ncbi:MAG: hypothetical protein AAGB31_11585 [Bdellovibrio sp.]
MEPTMDSYKANLENIKDNVKDELDRSGLTDRYYAAQAKAREAVDASEEFVKDHPFYTILGAAAIGFLAGVLVRRRH